MTGLFKRMKRAFTREDGTATIEFVISFPVLFFIFLLAFEAGMLMIRNIMLERAVDMTMRDLRLNNLTLPSAELLKDEICAKTLVIADCRNVIRINLQPVDTVAWNMPADAIPCIDRSETINPLDSVDPGVMDNLMLVRVCVATDALFPTTGLGLRLPKDGLGGYWLTAVSAFANEPS
jgi:hypothetical protein